MKKILFGLLVGLAVTASAIESLVVKNATNGTVFAVAYETGVSTVTVAGVVSATSFSPALNAAAAITAGSLTVQTNATVGGTLGVTGIATFAATQTVFSAVAATTPTNLVSGDGVGINVRINGTNYLIRATLN